MVRISFLTTPRAAAETCDPMGGASAPPYSIVANTAAFGNGFCAAAGIFPAARQKMRRKCENHLAIGHRFCYYEKAVLADNREGGASTNGKMSVLRQGLELRHQSEPLSPPLEPHLETQCEARQGHRGRQTPARLRMHPLPPQRQGHPRCVNCNHCTEQGSPDWASLFRVLGAFVPLRMQSASPAPARGGRAQSAFLWGRSLLGKAQTGTRHLKKNAPTRVCRAGAAEQAKVCVCGVKL